MNHNVSKKKRQDRQMEEKERGRSGPTGLNDRGERQKKNQLGRREVRERGDKNHTPKSHPLCQDRCL